MPYRSFVSEIKGDPGNRSESQYAAIRCLSNNPFLNQWQRKHITIRPAIAAKKKPAGSLSRPQQALALALTDCPQANTFALAERMVSLENVQAMCKNGYRDSFCTFGTDVTLHLKPAYDMDGRTTFNAVEVAYEVSFRGPDAMPGGLDDRAPFFVFICVVGCH